MVRRKTLLAVFVLFLLVPRISQAQATVNYVFSPPKHADFLLMGGLSVPIISMGRFSAGPGGMLGTISDNSDFERPGRHLHLTWMLTVTGAFRIGDHWGIGGGYGWGYVRKSAKPHLSDYGSWLAGLSFGF